MLVVVLKARAYALALGPLDGRIPWHCHGVVESCGLASSSRLFGWRSAPALCVRCPRVSPLPNPPRWEMPLWGQHQNSTRICIPHITTSIVIKPSSSPPLPATTAAAAAGERARSNVYGGRGCPAPCLAFGVIRSGLRSTTATLHASQFLHHPLLRQHQQEEQQHWPRQKRGMAVNVPGTPSAFGERPRDRRRHGTLIM